MSINVAPGKNTVPVEETMNNFTPNKLFKIMIGPLLFFLALMMPVFGDTVQPRIGFGILFWMIYWWVSGAVDMKITCLVPLIVVAFYPFVGREDALKLYMHKDIYLIIGASMITSAWVRWELARRVALKFLSKFGNDVQLQMVGWFWLCGLVSFVMGNTPVGAIFAPIAVAALLYSGYKTYQQRYDSKAASNILIAVAWGASIGGMATPLGGGQATVTWSFLNDYIGYEIFFIDWSLRMVPISLLVMIACSLFMYYFMKPDPNELKFTGTKDFYKEELQKLGPMTFEEKILGYGFLSIILLAICRPLYADFLTGNAFAWLQPAHMFFIFAILLFIVPSKKEKGETLLSIPALTQNFPAAILFIWPGSIALSRVLQNTGASEVFATWLQPLIDGSSTIAIIGISAVATTLSQFTSDTAAAGIMIPLLMDAFHNWNGLEYGSVAFIWIAGASLSWSFAVVSASGAQAIVAGFGANIKRLFTYGLAVAAISIIVTAIYFVITVGILQLPFYTMPPGM